MNSLAIFDIDGTLTDTNAVDDACYRAAVAEALGVPESAIDWSGTAHFTDRAIFDWLSGIHGGRLPTDDEIAHARDRLTRRLSDAMADSPASFAPIVGAPEIFDRLRASDWSISVATGCWGPSARLKLRAAGIEVDEGLIACADDAAARTDIVRLSRSRARSFYGREFDRVVSIGDGLWDVETAIALALPFIGVGRGEKRARLARAGASVVIENYSDHAAFMAALDQARVPGDG